MIKNIKIIPITMPSKGVRDRVNSICAETGKCFLRDSDWTVGTAAMLLAITRTIKAEEDVKSLLRNKNLKYVVTEIGGKSMGEFQERTTRSIIGACLNSGLISKTTKEIHALLHAAEEAKRGIVVNSSSSTSLALKIAIVKDDTWIAVAMYGESAIHPITNHERAGLGIMHI